MMNSGYGMIGWGFGGWIFCLFILLIIAATVLIIFFALRKRLYDGPVENETPLDILKKRYAKGEITKNEFEEIKKDLQ